MKRSLVVFAGMALSILSHGQDPLSRNDLKHFKERIAPIWEEATPAFAVNKVPSKWADRSGVVIAKKTNILVRKLGSPMQIVITESARFKIWLHDNDAVKSYSELYFLLHRFYNGFAARVIKANGKIEDIDLAPAIAVEKMADVPEQFKPYIVHNLTDEPPKTSTHQYYKIAVPNLQPGDIIEYAYSSLESYQVFEQRHYEMEPIYYLLNRDIPVMYQAYEIKTPREVYLNHRSFNGAPEFVEDKDDKDDKVSTYNLVDKDREVSIDQSWLNRNMELPLVKFQVIFSNSRQYDRELFIHTKGTPTQDSFSMDEFAFKVKNQYEEIKDQLHTQYPVSAYLIYNIQQELKKAGGKSLSQEEYIRKTYYLLRHAIGLTSILKSKYFACAFVENLRERKIPSKLVITCPNNVTMLKDILFRDEMEWAVLVDGKYIYDFTQNSNIYESYPALEGNQAYVISVERKPEPPLRVTLPASAADNNKSAYQMEVALDDNLENLSVHSTTAYSGFAKLSTSEAILTYTSALLEDYKAYGGKDSLDEIKSKSYREDYERRTAAEIDENNRKKPEFMKKQLGGDYKNVVSYDEFKLLSDGRTLEKPVLKYSEKYVLGDMVKKAGKNLLISLPQLMGQQVQVKQGERQRQHDIDVRYAKTFQWKIAFTIPAGFNVDNLNDMNSNVDNETGTFISTARVEDHQLILEIRKAYKQRCIKKGDWDKMLAFLDAGYNFSQKKIVLRKG